MKTTTRPEDVDESAISELTIAPDGRVFAFGITRGIVELLRSLPTAGNPPAGGAGGTIAIPAPAPAETQEDRR